MLCGQQEEVNWLLILLKLAELFKCKTLRQLRVVQGGGRGAAGGAEEETSSENKLENQINLAKGPKMVKQKMEKVFRSLLLFFFYF